MYTLCSRIENILMRVCGNNETASAVEGREKLTSERVRNVD